MATRGDWELVGNDCRGALWSDERFGADSLTATSRRGLLLSGCFRTSMTSDPPFSPYGMVKSVLVCCCR